MTGIIVAGFGGGAFLFGQIAIAIVNPDGENVDPDTGYFEAGSSVPGRVPLMFFLLGCCYLILYMVGSILISEKPESEDGSCDGRHSSNSNSISSTTTDIAVEPNGSSGKHTGVSAGRGIRLGIRLPGGAGAGGAGGNYAPCAGDVEEADTGSGVVMSALHADRHIDTRSYPAFASLSATAAATVNANNIANTTNYSSTLGNAEPTAEPAATSSYFGGFVGAVTSLSQFTTSTSTSTSQPYPIGTSGADNDTLPKGQQTGEVPGAVFTILGEEDEEEDDEDEERRTVLELNPLSTLRPQKVSHSHATQQEQEGPESFSRSDSVSSSAHLCAAPGSPGDNTSHTPVSFAADGSTRPGVAEFSTGDVIIAHPHHFSPVEIIKFPLTWHIAACFVTTSAGGMYLAGTFKEYGEQYLHSEEFLSNVAACSSLFNAAGRIFWGEFADRTSPTTALLWLSLSFALVIITYSNIAISIGQFGYALWTFAIFFCEGGNFSLYLPLLVNVYGGTHCAANYGIIFTVYSTFVVINIILMTQIETISFQMATLLIGCMTLIGFMNVYLLKNHIVSFLPSK